MVLNSLVLAHHEDGYDDDNGCDDGKDSGVPVLAAHHENDDEDSGNCGRNSLTSYL